MFNLQFCKGFTSTSIDGKYFVPTPNRENVFFQCLDLQWEKTKKPSTRGCLLPPFSIVKEQCGAIGGRKKGKRLGGRGEMKQGNRKNGIGT